MFSIYIKIICSFFSKLMDKLKENKKYSEALELLSYADNATPEELLSCALEGQLYRKALSICKRFKRTDLIGKRYFYIGNKLFIIVL